MNKFELVFSDDHQMSVAGVGYPGPMFRGWGRVRYSVSMLGAGYPGSGKGGQGRFHVQGRGYPTM